MFFLSGRFTLTLAVVCALGALLAGAGHRFGWWPLGFGFGALRWFAYGAIAATVLAIAGAIRARPGTGRSGFAASIVAIAVAAVTFGIPATMLAKAKRVPPIHDITTDTADPPKFVAILPLRASASNSTEYGGARVADQQKRAYPDIVPFETPAPPDQAFATALDAARGMGWDIVASVPADGRIEATDTTLLFGFKDDVVIRVTPTSQGSRIDVRSESRVGGSDIGTNAKRIAAFLAKLK